MKTVEEILETLNLQVHPEGGYFSEVYRSAVTIPETTLPDRFSGERNVCTSIIFLLPSHHRSLFHRIKSDELWFFHEGSSLSIYIIENDKCRVVKLGNNSLEGEHYQLMVPANCWFGAIVNGPGAYTLCSCTVAPGFDFDDFEIAERPQLLNEYPHLQKEIMLLTNP
jgi:uncharacterized protein